MIYAPMPISGIGATKTCSSTCGLEAGDDLYRLTGEIIQNDPVSINGAIGYTYDPVGNRNQRTSDLSQIPGQTFTGQYDLNDRLTAGYTYDSDGNTLTDPTAKTYTYDSLDRLLTVTGSGLNESFIYDGDGNKVSQTVNSVTTNYLISSTNLTGYAQVMDELQGGAVGRTYTYGISRIAEDQEAISNGSFVPGTFTLSYYGYDGQGSVRYLMNSAGQVTGDTYTLDAFGNSISSTGSTQNVCQFDGEQLDPNTGFYNLRARWMNPGIGRFETMDSYEGETEDPLTLHKYEFASNNPENRFDPSGNDDGGISSEPHVFWSALAHDLAGTIRFEFLPISEVDNDGHSCGFLLNAHALTVNRIPKFNVYRWVQRVKTDIPLTSRQPKDDWYFDGFIPNSPQAIANGFPQGSPWPLLYPTTIEKALQQTDKGNARFTDQSQRPRKDIDNNGGSCHWEAQAYLVGLDNWNTTSFNSYLGEIDWGWKVTKEGSIYNVTADPVVFNYLY